MDECCKSAIPKLSRFVQLDSYLMTLDGTALLCANMKRVCKPRLFDANAPEVNEMRSPCTAEVRALGGEA